ncbi:MAG: chemotaxis protein CheX, partial [Desulfobacula sp.]|nr:chemotaxis protein CheX [Desulfobacula sp.]
HLLQQIYKNLFGPEKTTSKAELFDAAGELTNMISGGAKAELSNQEFFFDVAVPLLSQSPPQIPGHLKKNPIILVPFDTKAGDYTIQASIQKIEEDFAEETALEIPPPEGMISVTQFSKFTGMGKIKIRRFLKTGFLKGTKVDQTQWHIPEKELEKVHVKKIYKKVHASTGNIDDTYVTISEFSRLSRLTPAKIKSFLRSGFLKGIQDETHGWHIKKHHVSKFRK